MSVRRGEYKGAEREREKKIAVWKRIAKGEKIFSVSRVFSRGG